MRSFEDAIDTLLMRSRAEAELARLTSDAQRLAALADTIAALAADSPLRCALAADDAVADDGAAAADGVDGAAATTDGVRVRALRINSIAYVRGKARVAVDKLHLPVPGVYAIAGPNGSGKSTLFALIGACHQALLRGDSTTMPFAGSRTPSGAAHLPAGLMITSMGGDVELPRRADGAPPYVIEVSQRQYTPLHCRPIDWLTSDEPLATGGAASGAEKQREEELAAAARVASLAAELRLGLGETEESENGGAEGGANAFIHSLLREHEDWSGAMSGGQRVKLELIRSVFIRRECPDVLLLDEALAPLDPHSKRLVMRRLRVFCAASLVLVVYHAENHAEGRTRADPGTRSSNGAADERGVPMASLSALADEACHAGQGAFFDGVVRFRDGNVSFDSALDRCQH